MSKVHRDIERKEAERKMSCDYLQRGRMKLVNQFTLIVLKNLLASRFSEAVKEERLENWCRLRSSHMWGYKIDAHTLRNVPMSVYCDKVSRES